MRYVAAVISAVVLIGGLFFVYSYYLDQQLLISDDPVRAQESSMTLLHYFVIASGLAIILLALLVFSVISTRSLARRMAYRISHDLSFTHDQFRRFYELSPVPYLLVTPRGEIMRPNKASLRMFGLSGEELLQKNIFELITIPEQADRST